MGLGVKAARKESGLPLVEKPDEVVLGRSLEMDFLGLMCQAGCMVGGFAISRWRRQSRGPTQGW